MIISAKKGISIIITVYLVGLAGFLIPYTTDIFIRLIPVNMLFNFFILLYFHENYKIKVLISALLIYSISFITECAGVNYGIIFGQYSYSNILWISLYNTPLIIGLNWLMLIYCVYIIIQKLHLNIILKILAGSIIMVLYDLFLEPVAKGTGMWEWYNDTVPANNYIAWGVLSFIFLSGLFIFRIRFFNKIAIPLFIAQSCFFIILSVRYILF